jgi:hypothetical protein
MHDTSFVTKNRRHQKETTNLKELRTRLQFLDSRLNSQSDPIIQEMIEPTEEAIRKTDDEMTNCVDCRWNTPLLGEWYMVRDSVWNAAGMETMGGCLCIGCLEERLGRRLTPEDFIDCKINDPNLLNTSSRLRARLSALQR